MSIMANHNDLRNGEVSEKRSEVNEEEEYTTSVRWHTIIILGIQHFLTMCAPNAMASLILINSLCLANDSPLKSELISASFFVMGIATFLQTTLGCRMPIIQGATFSILLPTLTLMNMEELRSCNVSDNKFINYYLQNSTPESVFHLKMKLINGGFMVVSLVEIFMAASGALYVITRLISPLSLAAIYTVLSLSICEHLINLMSEQWLIGFISMVVMVIVSIILAPRPIPVPVWSKIKGWHFERFKIFQISPVLFSVLFIWILCFILTATGALSKQPGGWGYGARTDLKIRVFQDSPIFKIPYPFQWGQPIVLTSIVIGMSTGVIISIIESIGDYIIIAETCHAPKIPQFAINRGILIEGVAVFLSGLLGSAVGPTSYSDNIGLIKITKSGNTRIAQVAAVIMLICGIFPIVGSLFVTIPNPATGGITLIITLMIMACGVGNLRFVDLCSTRNTLVYGFSIAFGIYLPNWVKYNVHNLRTGNQIADEVIQIILSNCLFIAAVVSIFLDNVLPGTYHCIEDKASNEETNKSQKCHSKLDICVFYDLRILKFLSIKFSFLQYLPLFPAYRKLELTREAELDNEEKQISKF